MAQAYDLNAYLLDKSQIADTLNRMALGFDGDHQLLIDRVYTPEVHLDYDLLGFKPETITVQEWTERLTKIHESYDTTQHIIHNLIIDLPNPSTALERPNVATAVAHAHGYFYNKDDKGIPQKLAMRQGGNYKLEFVRLPEVKDNPWRLSKMQVRLLWRDSA